MQTLKFLPVLILGTVAVGAPAMAAEAPKAEVTCEATDQAMVYDCRIALTGGHSATPIEGAKITVSAEMPSMPAAHNVEPVAATPTDQPGIYQARITLEMWGEWALHLDLSEPVRDRLVHTQNFTNGAAASGHSPPHQQHMAAGPAVEAGDLVISGAWARASAGAAKNGAAYLTITNNGTEMDKLVKIETAKARKTEMHTVLMENNVMKMRRLKGIEVHPGEPAVMAPGGNHIMLMGLHDRLNKGEHFPITLTFEKAGLVEVMVAVGAVGALQAPMHHGKGHGADGKMKMKMN